MSNTTGPPVGISLPARRMPPTCFLQNKPTPSAESPCMEFICALSSLPAGSEYPGKQVVTETWGQVAKIFLQHLEWPETVLACGNSPAVSVSACPCVFFLLHRMGKAEQKTCAWSSHCEQTTQSRRSGDTLTPLPLPVREAFISGC